VKRACDACGMSYEAQRSTSRYCGDTCKKRGQRGAGKVVDLPRQETEHALVAAVRVELAEAERLDTSSGQAALALALRIVAGVDTGSAIASMTRELRAVMAEALRGAKQAQSRVEQRKDELAARRRRA